MVFRVFVEKRPTFDVEAKHLTEELRLILGISSLEDVRLINRYDVEDIDRELFEQCIPTVFSEPMADVASEKMFPVDPGDKVFAVEYLPGQFDQRADSASECIQLISQGERPEVRSAKVYVLKGDITPEQLDAIKNYVINPVEAREAGLGHPVTLKTEYPKPPMVETLSGFLRLDEEGLANMVDELGLAMDLADIKFCQEYFASERRDPTITEIRMIDTYWSDHCRHTTFGTQLEKVEIDDPRVKAAYERYLQMRTATGRENRPVTLMDMGTMGARYLKKTGELTGVDESEEINACTVKVKVDVNGTDEDWLFLFKNETHNHPTEIEPFGGAATCIGGAIRDPLAGRSYVHQAMRITGSGDPLVPVSQTIPGKLPQRKLAVTSAQGYSSYGNQIGLATGQVTELYHPGYVAKHLELGAVVGATPANFVRREEPQPGDVIVLLGGRTGRDGIGGATGSSKAHKLESLETCGAEVQKGNAPVERKLQRLFRRKDACELIKRCNDFGAGGVSVAIGELADGLDINLDLVPKKYDGLDGTELAISESQERMAVALDATDVERFLAIAREENLEATPVATVTDLARLRMTWEGETICDVSREFLSSNGAPKHMDAHVVDARPYERNWAGASFAQQMESLVTDINVASNKGLAERFDASIGAGTVLMPFGGSRQLTAPMAMVAKMPVLGETTTVSGMSFGFNPHLMEADPFVGAYTSVVESMAKLVATGFSRDDIYLTFQEYFERLRDVPERWGKPVAALLGALMAQADLGVAAIGGKDSMSGSFEDLDVPPTLVSFAVAAGRVDNIVSPEFKYADSRVISVVPSYGDDGIVPEAQSFRAALAYVEELISSGVAYSVSTPGYGCAAESIFKMCVGNGIGISLNDKFTAESLLTPAYGSFIVELAEGTELPAVPAGADIAIGELGTTTEAYVLDACGESIDLAQLQEAWEAKLEPVYPYRRTGEKLEAVTYKREGAAPKTSGIHVARPRVLIPVFPGNNCEFDSARAFERAGAIPQVLVVNNLTPEAVAQSAEALVKGIDESQIVMIPGGFSGGDEPDGSAKFITAFFRAPAVTEAVRRLLNERDGLMLGICNGFQALVKLGLVPFGDIRDMDEDCPTLTFNSIGRHQSRLVRTRVASNKSPWLSLCQPGDIHTIAISHGEGRFVANDEVLASMKAAGQIATQYVDADGVPSMDLDVNPNGSVWAIEGITSPDGRIFGKMGHTERASKGTFQNVGGNIFQPIFEGGVCYFTD